MRAIVVAAMFMLIPMSGCLLAPDAKLCSPDLTVGKPDIGIHVIVAETVGEGEDEADTKGWCVELRTTATTDDWNERKKVPKSHDVWFDVPPGNYTLDMLVRRPTDAFCLFDVEAGPLEYNGTGVMQVHLGHDHDGLMMCS